MNASNITAGTIDPARLGSGTANSTNVLYGDSTWGAVSASGNATWGSITGNMTTQADLTGALNDKVNTSTTVNGQALSGNVTISGTDVGLPDGVAVGDILSWNGTAWNYVSAGDAGQVLTANSTSSLPYWADSTVSSGTTMPATAVIGQQFYQNTTGRDVLYSYNGTAWQPLQGFGTLTYYVDGTDGTDDQNHGTGVDASAYKTVQYAWDQIPPIITGLVSVYLSGDTYSESVSLQGKPSYSLPAYTDAPITFYGTLNDITEAGDGTATGGGNGSGAAHTYVTGTFTANQYNAKLIRFASGPNNGYERIIGYTSNTTLWLDGDALPAPPANNDTYVIYDWATILSGETTVGPMSTAVLRFTHLAFVNTSGGKVVGPWGGALFYIDYSKVTQNGSNYGVWIGGMGAVISYNSYFYQQSTAFGALIKVEMGGFFEGVGVKVVGSDVGGVSLIDTDVQSTTTLWAGFEIDSGAFGLFVQANSAAHLTPGGLGSVTGYIHGNGTRGIQANGHSFIEVASGVTYGKLLDNSTADANGADSFAEAASYSYITA